MKRVDPILVGVVVAIMIVWGVALWWSLKERALLPHSEPVKYEPYSPEEWPLEEGIEPKG